MTPDLSSLQPDVSSLAAQSFLVEIHQHQKNLVKKLCICDKDQRASTEQFNSEEIGTVTNMKNIKNLLNLIIYQPGVFMDMERTKSEWNKCELWYRSKRLDHIKQALVSLEYMTLQAIFHQVLTPFIPRFLEGCSVFLGDTNSAKHDSDKDQYVNRVRDSSAVEKSSHSRSQQMSLMSYRTGKTALCIALLINFPYL